MWALSVTALRCGYTQQQTVTMIRNWHDKHNHEFDERGYMRFVYPSAYAEHLTWASILIFLLTRGAGPWSLDRLLGLEPAGRERR